MCRERLRNISYEGYRGVGIYNRSESDGGGDGRMVGEVEVEGWEEFWKN